MIYLDCLKGTAEVEMSTEIASKQTMRDIAAQVDPQLEPQLRQYRRLWLTKVDLEEAQGTIDEILRQKIPIPRKSRTGPLLLALTTALVVSYARPFVNSRGQSAIAEKTAPGSLLRVLNAYERSFHNDLIDIRNQEVAHSDADALELTIMLYTDGEGAIVHVFREPFRRTELRILRRMIKKILGEIEIRCAALRLVLPLGKWL